MYLILQGELRARVMTGGQETILSTFDTGDFLATCPCSIGARVPPT